MSSIMFSVLFVFFFIHYLYSELYLSSIEESIVYQGKRTASHYHYGELSDEIIGKIQWYNIVSEYEVIVVDDLEELMKYFPYQINYETFIDPSDEATLQQGQYIMKEGFVEEFNREILGAIFPIKGEEGLIGFIYIYVPLAAIQDVFKGSIPILLIVGTIFFVVLFLVVYRVWQSMFRPLRDLEKLSKEVSKGNYAHVIQTDRHDEIGQLTRAFNDMSASLEQQEERKKEFTSNIVHELRTPLTYIGGYTEALKQETYTSVEEAGHYLTTIQKETERLNKLMNDLVDLDSLQENLYSIHREPIAIAQVLLETLDLFEIHMKRKNIQLNLSVDESLVVIGDEQRLHQVFYNTIDNAVKYSSQGGSIDISLESIGSTAKYLIRNHGVTIPPADIARIGERFYRTDKARNRTTGGTGLGLSIVKEIVRLHKGTFTITSTEEEGTIVTIQFSLLDLKEVEEE